jgi:hypothetical protein
MGFPLLHFGIQSESCLSECYCCLGLLLYNFFLLSPQGADEVGSNDGSLVTALCCGEGHFVHLERLCVADVIKYGKTSSLFIAYL